MEFPHRDHRFTAGVLLTLVLVSSLLIRLNHLGHGAIKALDESYHALVAKNLIQHPLTPTLYDKPWLEYDYRDWQNNHVWLHKPPVPLWQMALSMALLGVNTLALRLPSALLATAAVYLTYAIGRELLNDRRAALIAAALQGFNPAITSLVHGYVFSDHIDIAVLFWVELSVYFLVRAIKSGSMRWTALAGTAQGLAYLSKSYPAFVITAVAAVAVFLPLVGLAGREQVRLRGRHLAILLIATLITIAPWTIWCIVKFPREFWWEQAQVFRHLGTNIEGWAAPWDRLVFDFSLRIYHLFYPAVIVAAVLMLIRARQLKHAGLWLLLAWGFGVLLPHVIATSKTPTATLIGWPPFFLLLSALIVRGIDGDRACLGGWFAAVVLATFASGTIPREGWGYPDAPGFARILRDNIWVLIHVGTALVLAALAARLWLRGPVARWAHLAVVLLASGATIFLTARLAHIGWRITQLNRQHPTFAELGDLARRHLPDNAVLLLEITEKGEHVMAMFYVDRSVYPVAADAHEPLAGQIRAAGGLPLLVTHRSLPLPAAFDHAADGRRVYHLP